MACVLPPVNLAIMKVSTLPQRLGSINPLIDGFPTYWCWLQLVLNPDAWQFDRNLVAVALDYGVIWAVAA
jgi:hypothetical protein